MRIVDAERMRTLETRVFAELSVPPLVLMETAGRAIAHRVTSAAVSPEKTARIAVVSGQGNNGGDGLVAARVLHAQGRLVQVALIAAESELSDQAQHQLGLARAFGVRFVSLGDALATADLVIDALLGIGARQPLAPPLVAAVSAINGCGKKVLAVDLPSGLTDTAGPTVQADLTVTFHALKQPMTQWPGRGACGAVQVAEIGIPTDYFQNTDGFWLDEAWARTALATHPSQGADVHKGSFGHVAVWGGAPGKGGALHLAALAAYRAGAGLVTAVSSQDELSGLRQLPPEVMTAAPHDDAELVRALAPGTALCIGPGLDTAASTAAALATVLLDPRPQVLDADALNLLASNPANARSMDALARALGPGPRVLTPHPLEFTRLFGGSVAELQADRIGRARAAAKACGKVVVLKGAGTVVASPDEAWAVNSTGGRELAKGGTGDVLAGLIASFLAQGFGAFDAACLGAFIHGQAGALAAAASSQASVLASEVAGMLPEAMRALHT